MPKFEFEVVKHIATLSEKKTTAKEFNYISFNGEEPKYDIRVWQDPQTEEAKMLKGITLTREEVIKLKEALNNIEL